MALEKAYKGMCPERVKKTGKELLATESIRQFDLGDA
jgi:hypothetical protein